MGRARATDPGVWREKAERGSLHHPSIQVIVMSALQNVRMPLLVVALLAMTGGAAAQAPAPPQPLVLRAARMLDMESGRMLTNVRVVIEGDRIQSVNPA